MSSDFTEVIRPTRAPGALQGARILIVDDREANLVVLERILAGGGYSRFKSLHDPRDVLQEGLAFEPDIVLLDVQMPQLSGIEVLRSLRTLQAADSYLPVIMLTANLSQELKRQALEHGANDFLTRPFDREEVLLRLGNLLHTRALHQQLYAQNTTLATQVAARTQTLKEREAEARQHAERAQQLAELSARLELITEPHEVAREGLKTFMGLWGFDLGVLFQLEGQNLIPALKVGAMPPQLAALLQTLDLTLPNALQQQVMNQDEPVIVADYLTWEHALPEVQSLGLRTTIGVPLRVDGVLRMVMYLGKFGEPANLAYNAHIVLRGIQLRVERALERIALLENLRATREDALRVVGLTLEYRDFETKGHTDRVTLLAQRLGEAVHLSNLQSDYLTWGGYLHDTGKIAIPDPILLKPGKLTDAEFDTIKTHVTVGAEMLSHLDFLPAEVLHIVRHHHERFDGRGYPDGLVGENIPYLARIFSVADVYDALTSQRPYKAAWSHEDAVAELVRQKGLQFDPELVDAFLATFATGDEHRTVI